jgi:catechol 2,3-dioxygenase-like lactoylglutathione lyase family enzyme
MNRRKFIEVSSFTIPMLNVHLLMANQACTTHPQGLQSHRIKSLKLLTTSALDVMKDFYHLKLGLEIVEFSAQSLTLLAGLTELTFVRTFAPLRPFYHFAFNIPENKIEKAFQWQKKKCALVMPRPGDSRNPEKDIVHFTHWNAHSIFFLDPAGNLVEYIARHDLANAEDGEFSSKDILYASEIAFMVDEPIQIAQKIQKKFDLKVYKQPELNDDFNPMGDAMGLLLVIKKGVIWTGHPNQPNKTDIFKTEVVIGGEYVIDFWNIENYPYSIEVN